MNVELISKVLKRIEKDHKHFYMGWFLNRLTKKGKKYCSPHLQKLDCGTVCCFAGEIVIEALGPGALFKLGEVMVPNVAVVLAGLSNEDKEKLFYDGPCSVYGGDIPHAPGTRAYAKFVTGKIREYFADKGVTV